MNLLYPYGRKKCKMIADDTFLNLALEKIIDAVGKH